MFFLLPKRRNDRMQSKGLERQLPSPTEVVDNGSHDEDGDGLCDGLSSSPSERVHGLLLSHIFTFLDWKQIMKVRTVCLTWRDATLETPVDSLFVARQEVPWTQQTGLAQNIKLISKAMPNLSRLYLQDPDTSMILDLVSGGGRFQNLKSFGLYYCTTFGLFVHDNGRLSLYDEKNHSTTALPFGVDDDDWEERFRNNILENDERLDLSHIGHPQRAVPYMFTTLTSNLQILETCHSRKLSWDLSHLTYLPNLTELNCPNNQNLTGNVQQLKILSKTLVKCCLTGCIQVRGKLADFADFPRLEELYLYGTHVRGDIRVDIMRDDGGRGQRRCGNNNGVNDDKEPFRSLKKLELSQCIFGRQDVESIEDGEIQMMALQQLKKCRPGICIQTGPIRVLHSWMVIYPPEF